ncbi:MAG: type II toxin-antitoxin system MqsA family antitoxin [Candidatus Coatesbacteria bacterium]
MKCVICKQGEVRPSRSVAELKVGTDRLLVDVEAEVCGECGEAYFSAETMKSLEKMKSDFARKAISASPVGSVYQAQ